MTKKKEKEQLFLVVVDDAVEVKTALKFACRRAKRVGAHIALLSVVEKPSFQDWTGLSQTMDDEYHKEAEEQLEKWAALVQKRYGEMPIFFMREGPKKEAIEKVIEEEPKISMLVLGAATDSDGPGSLVSHFAGKISGKLRIPVMIVPGNLSDDQINMLA
ncbi:MAG: universal stress protein [Alphaproteobacteria bacterium]